ncbi:MAG: hypothetical protein JXA23_12475, partial [Bacteroidales bacterium]|nr:hypothetical protein [Bacteroidales bacterium]
MKLRKFILIHFFLCLWLGHTLAQTEPENACSVEDGKVLLTFDNRWTDLQKQKVQALFGIDSLLMAKAFEKLPEVTVNGITWKIRIVDANLVEIYKLTEDRTDSYSGLGDIVFLEDDWIGFGIQETTRVSEASGV